jgi:D-alanyl-D-alanine carboxypeptidase/D-alanyl-D-alanine-endopeptidase (penicillin-binding protein 4)
MRTNGFHKKLVWIVGAILFAAVCRAQSSVSQIVQAANPQKEKISLIVIRADNGAALFSRNADNPMIPASNMKLVVSAAALHYLGSSYAFQTQAGLLRKNLVIIGGGDPLLGEPGLQGSSAGEIFEQIAKTLSQNGISEVEDIILDDTFFDSNRVHPQWPPDQLNRWYACEVSGLNFNRNCVRLTARRVSGGSVVEIDPPTNYVTIKNQIKLISKGDSAVGAYRSQLPNALVVKGTLNQSAGFDVAIENPAGLFGALLRENLTSNGIQVKGKLIQKYIKSDPQIQILCRFQTPLSEVLNRSNKDSLGLAAEALVKTISAENTQGKINGEWPHGLHLIERYLQSLGIPKDQFVLKDGSGLCRENRLSPRAIVMVLQDMAQKPCWPVFKESLSKGGLDGTTMKYFKEDKYRGKIAGKTGYINGVRSFSGVCQTPQGDFLFSILTEGGSSQTRNKINEIAKAIFDGRW